MLKALADLTENTGRFGSQYPHDSSQPCVLGDMTFSPDLCRHQAYMWCTYIYAGKASYTFKRTFS